MGMGLYYTTSAAVEPAVRHAIERGQREEHQEMGATR